MRVHNGPRYLIPESFEQIEHLVKTHPLLGPFMLLLLFVIVLDILRRIFGRIAGDLILFALIISAIVLLCGSSLYTFTHVKGFHFGG